MGANARQTRDGMSAVDAVASVVSAGGAGQTADEIADALGLPIDGAALQPDLEEMVERGILARCGIGRGALYTLMVPLPTTRDAGGHSGMVGKGPTTRMAG
jgi:hypothetical protein